MRGSPEIYLNEKFIKRPEALFLTLKDSVVWDERMRTRKTASFGISYDYSGISYPQIEMPEYLMPVCQAIETTLKFHPNNCLMNFYPDGNSSMGFHSDSSEELAEGTGVAIVSLGAERIIAYKNKANSEIRSDVVLKNGSLLFMSKNLQNEWLHAIPKQENVGERISLTFRQIIK